jgi:hypothetical protein
VPISPSNRQPSSELLFRYRIAGFDAKGPKGPSIPSLPRRRRGNLRFSVRLRHTLMGSALVMPGPLLWVEGQLLLRPRGGERGEDETSI